MAESEVSSAAPVVPEYDRLFGWEKRACLKRFKFHLDRGIAARPGRAEVAWDRAVYLGYRGGLQAWAYVMIVSAIPLVVVAVVLRATSWRAIPIAICVLPALLALAMALIRIVQSHNRHANWRKYKLDEAATDWDVMLTN